ncbi:MAG: miaA [Bacillales bacterium]|jgi:tRNA dimethylallyltransferase|nr:miaA [Bacillales bacterium]
MKTTKEKLIVIVGPTAVGKTALSLELAKRFNGEIINGDAFQVYRGLDIGTAKITQSEMDGIPHHLIDIRNPEEQYNVVDYKNDVSKCIQDITTREKLPILVGGTGLYVQSVLYDYQFPETIEDAELREKLYTLDNYELHRQLSELDPVTATNIHPNNKKRVVRALEVCILSGKKFSEQTAASEKIALYDAIVIGLEMERNQLYERINARVLQMMNNGLENEVRKLVEKGLSEKQSMLAIGYKEFFPYFNNEKTIDEVINEIQQSSRNFAKRQFTWFRNKMDVQWFDMSDTSDFINNLDRICKFVDKELQS